MSKILVAYFSASGETARLAKTLAGVIGGDLFEIRPQTAYTAADLDWNNAKSRSSVEMNDPKSRPAMAETPRLAGYDTVFVGFPIWWYQAPRIIQTFLESADFSGKTVIPFATSGGSGMGKTVELLRSSCAPDTRWNEGKRLSSHASARIVGNPGCFAVSCLLGAAPAAKLGLVRPGSFIFDCKTGISGAGKKPNPSFHYPARYDQMNAYRLTGHQHVCEVEQNLAKLAGLADYPVTCTAQAMPATRGILTVCYADLNDGLDAAKVLEAYREFYRGRTFVKLYDRTAAIGTAQVRGSNFCKLIVDVDARTRKLRIVSHIDNLMKGQAGSALQNMNLLLGLPEDTALNFPGNYP